MKGNVRLTPVGAVLLVVLAAAIVAVLVGSKGLQAAGFIIIVIIALVLVADRLPRMRVFGGHDLGLRDPARGSVESDPPDVRDLKGQ